MIVRRLALLLSLVAAGTVFGADEPSPPSAREMLKARLAEEAKQPAPATAKPSPAATAGTSTTTTSTTASTEQNPLLATTTAPAAPSAPVEKSKRQAPATVLPKVEVRKGRITELDQQLAKQDQEIAREKKNTKPSEVDKALNDSKIARPLAIFGGESTQFRQRVSSERVSLMEDEKDILEAIAHAKTKEEKAELQKQLEALRAERRELEKALR